MDAEEKKEIEETRTSLKRCIEDEFIERQKMLDDLKFCTLDQWPIEIRNDREDVNQEGGPRPCLTIDKINQYIVQVVNDMRQGKPGINVRPMDDSADVETAKVIKGIIRNIEDQSKADIAYATGGESSAKIGLGFIRVMTEYSSPDSFDQEIFIKPIPNTFSTYLNSHIMPDGSDAKEGFIVETMPVEKFKREFPKKKFRPDDFTDLGDQVSYWSTHETVTVVEHYKLERENTTLFFLADGTTVTETQYDKWPAELGAKPTVQDKRPSFEEKLKWKKMTGIEVLEKRDLPGKYIPIIECIGRESWVEGRRILWGLVRPAKDSLRMYNYFASTITEKMGLAPKTPWIVAEGQIEGREKEWQESNRKNRAVLQYKAIDVNGNAVAAPQRIGPAPMEAALLHQMEVIEHDVQTSLGMFKAAVGETESQQSGRAILALQKESDTGTYHFGANLGVSIRHVGVVILDMIPHYYDTKRIVRILGEDGTQQTVQIDPNQEESHKKIQTDQGIKSIFNPGVGKYDIAISVGPSYNTKRMEAAATLTEVVKSQPQLMPLIGDLLFRSLDFPYSDQIAERLKKMLPPQLQQGSDPAQMLAQLQQKMQMMGQQMQEMQQENVQLKAGAQVKMAGIQMDSQIEAKKHEAAQVQVQATFALQKQKQDADLQLSREKASAELELVRAKAEEELRLERDRTTVQASLEKWKAELDARTKIEVAEISAKTDITTSQIQAASAATNTQ